MPLCIAGMHRSGTSMVTRLLNLCGLEVGPASELLRPRPSNREGFWENRRFLRVNEAILRELGGTWDCPPPLPLGWENRPALEQLRKNALRLVRPFRGCEPWGWKDPRNCLTLPFWNRLLPDLSVLLCVRNPLAVARSLHLRDGMSLASAFDLWLTYTRRLLAAVPAGERVVTHYDNYFVDAEAELQRLLGLLSMEATADDLGSASASIDRSLVHHQVTVDDLVTADAPSEVVECYLGLCAEAGFKTASSVHSVSSPLTSF
jgi:hypothetical protein